MIEPNAEWAPYAPSTGHRTDKSSKFSVINIFDHITSDMPLQAIGDADEIAWDSWCYIKEFKLTITL